MKVVIDIPENDYWLACNYPDALIGIYAHYIKKGVPLPEKHGRLIDADALIARCGNLAVDSENIVELSEGWTIPFESVIDIEPTVVEAEGEEDEE